MKTINQRLAEVEWLARHFLEEVQNRNNNRQEFGHFAQELLQKVNELRDAGLDSNKLQEHTRELTQNWNCRSHSILEHHLGQVIEEARFLQDGTEVRNLL